uniref:Uncharacterized protein n=1 Tax=Sinocyclocheilus rhinocerous TaxID=307959 RepID=A0A673K6M8_9TELE
MKNLHQRETALQNLQAQMRDFEMSVEPLQDWLNETEEAVQESSSRLHDLTAKKQELHRLQVQYIGLFFMYYTLFLILIY